MAALLTLLKGIKLSLTQYALLTMALIIGGLVAALKLQGSKLHKAQVTILDQHVQSQDLADSAKVAASSKRFSDAYGAYMRAKQKAGKR